MRLSELVRGPGRSRPADRRADPEVTGVEHDSRRGARRATSSWPSPASASTAAPSRRRRWRRAPSPSSAPSRARRRRALRPLAGRRPIPARAPRPARRPRLRPSRARADPGRRSPAPTASRPSPPCSPRSSSAAGHPAGFIGTLGYRFGEHDLRRRRTPRPRPPTSSASCARCATTAPRRSPWRSPPTPWPWAGWPAPSSTPRSFTNLTRDHLDYPPRLRGLLRGQAPALRPAEAGRAAGGQRRRPLRPPARRGDPGRPHLRRARARSRPATWR